MITKQENTLDKQSSASAGAIQPRWKLAVGALIATSIGVVAIVYAVAILLPWLWTQAQPFGVVSFIASLGCSRLYGKIESREAKDKLLVLAVWALFIALVASILMLSSSGTHFVVRLWLGAAFGVVSPQVAKVLAIGVRKYWRWFGLCIKPLWQKIVM